ncbi:MAG: sodium:proton antiporter [Devosia sp.]|uniref:cation:proton antiporter n=1 Tax=Devosia sp. 66-22 TaxID=1895753 RepID=UPI000AAF3E97|nr:sodium:proton antiporter [Devosia sp. 66-22]MBN9347314.1 sodium:proton antiporter [Devosia sp.]
MVSQILIVMIAAIWVTMFAERRNIQAPLLLVAVGLAASFIPRLGRLELEPEIILTVVLPPLLFSAASEFSFISFIRRLGSIFNLGVLLVAVTTAVVGAIAAATIPGMTLLVALVLGAVISPPDAVTAVAVGRKLKLPSRMMTVLKGESLINDAAALTLFTFAVASVTGTHLAIDNLFLFLGYAAVVGIVVGLVIGAIVHRVRLRLTNATLSTVLSVLVPFTAYILAEELGASGVLAVVAAGLSLGHNSRESGYAARMQERQFWRTTDALLEAFVFAYIGLQFRWVLTGAAEKGIDVPQLLGLSVVILVAAMAVRVGWVFFTSILSRWRSRVVARRYAEFDRQIAMLEAEQAERLAGRRGRFSQRLEQAREARKQGAFELLPPFTWQENLVIGWTGMRGVVTLAAAAGIPLLTVAGEPFPGRDAIQVVAFVVTVGTLLIQGLTLPWLIRRLAISDPDDERKRQEQFKVADAVARAATVEAVTAFRDTHHDAKSRRLAEMMLQRSAALDRDSRFTEANDVMLELKEQILVAQRLAVVKARDERRLDDEVMREVLEELDLEQAATAGTTPGRFGGRD